MISVGHSASNSPPAIQEDVTQQKLQYNYATISRYDPLLAQIICTSAICTVYKFDMDAGEWDKVNCQGTIFVYSRAMPVAKLSDFSPSSSSDLQKFPYGLFVLNRLNADNFSLGLCPKSICQRTGSPNMEVSLDNPYIMVQATDGAMYGLWLFNESDRKPVCDALNWCLTQEL